MCNKKDGNIITRVTMALSKRRIAVIATQLNDEHKHVWICKKFSSLKSD